MKINELQPIEYLPNSNEDIDSKNNPTEQFINEEPASRPEDFKMLLDIYINESDFGVDISNGYIYLTGEIDETTFEYIVKRINILRKFRADDDAPITFIINSFGGDAYEAFGIIDYIRSLPFKIDVITYTKAMSAAAMILIAATGTRRMSANATLMLHELSSESFGKAGDIKANTKHLKSLENIIYDILHDCTKKPKTHWIKHLNPDLYLTAKQSLLYGLIDEILD